MWKVRRARYTNASSVAKKFVLTYELGHHTHCLSFTQVAPGHVNEFLAMNTEGVKSENPELKKVLVSISNVSNGLIFLNLLVLFQILINLYNE